MYEVVFRVVSLSGVIERNYGGMSVNSFNLISFIASCIGWLVILSIALRVYKRQVEKPKRWLLFSFILGGLLSFSFNVVLWGELVRFAILPLGVWIMYAFLRRKEGGWTLYRPYAWLGFWGNYIFLATTLLSLPIHDAIYPADDPSTYISNVKNASLIHLHPSARGEGIQKEHLLSHLKSMKPEMFFTEEWYEATYLNREENERERMPYQLIGVAPKWGSGRSAALFIEEDGKGILLTTEEKQYYYRLDASVIEGVE